MSYPRTAIANTTPQSTGTQWTVRHRNAPVVATAERRATRRVNLQWLDASGQIQDAMRLAPAVAIFDDLFSAFARGTLLPTAQGPVAVEDLMAGDTVETSNGPSIIRWIGSTTILPGASRQSVPPLRIFRIAADSLGLGRPMPDLMLGDGARILNRSGSAHDDHGAAGVLEPVRTLIDGESVIALNPVSPVMTYHIGFDRHRTFQANGVEVESMHPGPLNPNRLDAGDLPMLLGLLPHVRQYADLGRLLFPRVDDRTDRQPAS